MAIIQMINIGYFFKIFRISFSSSSSSFEQMERDLKYKSFERFEDHPVIIMLRNLTSVEFISSTGYLRKVVIIQFKLQLIHD